MGKDKPGMVWVVKTVGIAEGSVGSGATREVVAHHVLHVVSHQTAGDHLMALQAGVVGTVARPPAQVGLLDEEIVAGVAHHWPGVRGRAGGMQHIEGGACQGGVARGTEPATDPAQGPTGARLLNLTENLYGFSFYTFCLSLSLTICSPQFLALQCRFHRHVRVTVHAARQGRATEGRLLHFSAELRSFPAFFTFPAGEGGGLKAVGECTVSVLMPQYSPPLTACGIGTLCTAMQKCSLK